MAAWIWVLIPLAAILMGGFKEWLAFKAKQEQLGTSTRELEETMHRLERALEESEEQRKAVERRLQNLETIVTSQAWDALHEGERLSSEQAPPLSLDDELAAREEPSDTEKAERLARQLKI